MLLEGGIEYYRKTTWKEIEFYENYYQMEKIFLMQDGERTKTRMLEYRFSGGLTIPLYHWSPLDCLST